ncbi:MAG: peptidoglycan glycosyltransferase, partial [Clostridiales bacterium]|nr:peptidoglycan glycosyltransferase [Clostridiales bacterium]
MDKRKKRKGRTTTKKRMIVLLCIFTLVLTVLVGKIGWIQFVKGEEYQKLAFINQNKGRVIPAKRGTIYDRNGKELAISASVDQVNINPETIRAEGNDLEVNGTSSCEKYQQKVAQGLSDILSLNYDDILKKVQQPGRYVEIMRKVDKDIGDKVRQWKTDQQIKGVNIDEDVKRYYPNGSLACHVLGFTGRDDQGLVCGVEVAFDDYLKGKAGRIISEVDAKGRELPYKPETRIDPQDGNNVVLTIDETIQYIIEKNLKQSVLDYNVTEGAACIAMDPNTGEILGMASYPDFDLNNPYACPPGYDPATWMGNDAGSVEALSKTVWRNKALTDTYEPGSTFKAITGSAALEEGVTKLDTMYSDSPLNIAGWTISCWRKGSNHGTETFVQAAENSCNPVFAKIALQLGKEKFYQYIDAFGFRSKTGIELSGEANSIFHSDPQDIDVAVTGFGQRFQITPMQLITAYSAIANGGNLMKPMIVKELTDNNGNVIKRYSPQV